MNSVESARESKLAGGRGYGGFFNENSVITKEDVLWMQSAVDLLKEVVEKTGAVIVISSTWRINHSLKRFKEMFSLYGWEDAPVIDHTPRTMDGFRGREINIWIREQEDFDGLKIYKYVIVDDSSDFFEEQKKHHFVHTDSVVGLTRYDADKMMEILT